ncbi:MAG: AAA family ATPase, partial [Eubacteriales bacterium]
MRLKTLELCGFKSFPDKTVISFNDGMTAIVGPNGSGKSNISDAVRWVLGETSSKSIRGAKMEDVIFGGTDKRRPMTFAEVTITLDNTDESSRMDIDYDEVSVTRRLSRTGDGEYFINRSPCRLKDINELFLNTGLGHSGYSIISQGRVADIISQKSDERRAIFEEAAGIAKYKYKKNEAERSLAAVSDNLSRVSDILSEIEGRLGPLESEAARARDYLALYEEKKRADISLAVYDITGIKNKLTASDAAFEASKNQLDICDEGLSSLDAQSERTFNSIQS